MKLINKEHFDRQIKGKQVGLFTLQNSHGMTCQITNYGSRIVSLWVPDKNGDFDDIVFGYHCIDEYLSSNGQYYGAIIGRYANRIADGRFTLESNTYTLFRNDGSNHIHGGAEGFNNKIWEAYQPSKNQLELTYLSEDREEGYPGNLSVKVVYELDEDNGLQISYSATTDKLTHVNLTNHSFFNLRGICEDSIIHHLIQIHARTYTALGEDGIPTGEIYSVENSPLDFTQLEPIGKYIDDHHEQIERGHGYDHNYIIEGTGLRLAARVEEPISGRVMEVITTEPGMQFYTSNFLDGSDIGKNGVPFGYRGSFCLETQHFPNTPNESHFPSTVLHPNDTYTSTCIYKFSVNE